MSFSVVIDSVDAFENVNGVYNRKYAIDWSFLPEGEYDLTYSFVSAPSLAGASDVKGIALEGLGTQLQVYLAGSQTDTKSCNLIGLLNRVNFNDGTAKQRFQQPSFNPPVVLKQRPSNNIFSVRMVNTISGSASAGMGGTYILILHFSKRGV